MKRFMLSILSLVMINAAFSQDFTTEELIIKKGDKYYGELEKQIYYYDTNNVFFRADNIMTKAASEKHGILRQNVYLRNNIVYKYEIYFTEKYTLETNCKSKIEYVDANDNVIGVEYTFYNDDKIELLDNDYRRMESFPPKRLHYFLESVFEQPKNEREMICEVPVFRGLSYLEVYTEKTPLTAKEKALIQRWMHMHNFPDNSGLYKYKVRVIENGKPFYVFVQDQVFKDVRKDFSGLMNYYYIGGVMEGPIFLGIDYIIKAK